MSQVSVLVGARGLLGIEPSSTAIATRVQNFSLFELLDICGRLSSVIHNSRESHDAEQIAFCEMLNSPEKFALLSRRVSLMRFRSARDDGGPLATLTLVSHRSLLAVLQVASQVCSREKEIEVHGPYDDFFEAILIANDLINSPSYIPTEANFETDESMRWWIYYLSIISPEFGSEPSVHLLSRVRELFFLGHAQLSKHPDYLSLDRIFEEATTLSIDSYMLAFLSIVAPLYRINGSNFIVETASVPHAFFENSALRFTNEQVKQFFALTGQPVEVFVSNVASEYRSAEIKPFYYLPFEKSPLVDFTEAAVCLSLPLLERKLTSGIYHILFDAPQYNEDATYKPKFQRFFGAIFARYVADSLKRIGVYADRRSLRGKKAESRRCRWISETELQQAMNLPEHRRPPICDGLLVADDTVFAVEIKAKIFSVSARSGSDPDSFFSRLEEIGVAGAKQLDSTVQQISAGIFSSLKIDPGHIRHVYPVIISLQEFFLNRPLASWLTSRLSEEGWLQQNDFNGMRIHPLELLDVADLEWLELVVEHGNLSMKQVLETKSASYTTNAISLANWGQLNHIGNLDSKDRSSFHAANFAELSDGALSLFRARRQGTI